jgi:hypothetical protein
MKTVALSLILILGICVGAMAWPVPDTGQSSCYDNSRSIPCPEPGEAFYGQDGTYNINPPSFTKLDSQGNELPDSATEWVMVRDNVTGLIWEVKEQNDHVPEYLNPHDADNRYTWYDSNPETNGGNAGTPGDGTDTEDFINALNSENFGGFSDWRLPTIHELMSIVDYETYSPTIDTLYFPNTEIDDGKGYLSYRYFTSNTMGYSGANSVWCLDFDHAGSSQCPKRHTHRIYCARAVRGARAWSSHHFIINDDNTITDTNTGLMWQRECPGSQINWEEAIGHCENLSLAGYSDWRLPAVKELQSIVNPEKYDPAIDKEYFPDTLSDVNELYATSTTSMCATIYHLYVSFVTGGTGRCGDKLCKYYVRCVRGGQNRLPDHLVISSPIQASRWDVGSLMPIRWENCPDIWGNVKISISRQGGRDSTFETIVGSTTNYWIYNWTVTGPASVNCVLKIEPVSDPSKATMQGLFTIHAIAGDIDGSGGVDLTDVILALQIINGSTPAISLHNGSDVNGDGRIGLEEAVYALQIVSEQR